MKPSLGRIVLYSYGLNHSVKPAVVTHVYEASPVDAVDLEVFGLPPDDPQRFPKCVGMRPSVLEELDHWYWPPRV